MSAVPWKHLIAAIVLFILYFYGLSGIGVLDKDEPRYSSIGRDMAESGDWVTPRLWGEKWFEKPALLYWMVASGYKAGLSDELAPRVPIALLSVAFLFFYFHQLRREFGATVAIYSAMMLATTAGWLAYGQIAVTDLPMSATFSAAMLLCLPWVRSGGRRGLLLGGVLLGFAVLAKGLVPLVLSLPLIWVGRKRWKDLLLFGAATFLVAFPWYFLCWYQNGQVFLAEFFWKHHFERFSSAELHHVQPWWFYLPVLAGLLFPWTPALFSVWNRKHLSDARVTLLVSWLVFGLVFFSAAKNKLPGYVLPLLPSACVLMALSLVESKRNRWATPLAGALGALVPLAATILPQALVSGLGDAHFTGLPITSLLFGVVLASLCGIAEYFGRRTAAMAVVTVGMLAGVVLIKLTTYPLLDQLASVRPLWKAVSARQHDVCLEDLRPIWRYGLNFYSHVPLPACKDLPKPLRIVPSGEGVPRILSTHIPM